jgi:poly [ADP-ribose] polymerase
MNSDPKVDEYCTGSGIRVYKQYSCILNQTDLNKNANKFYILQIHLTPTNQYWLWTRYGRVGEKGKSTNIYYPSSHTAIHEFCKKYYSKTGNRWGQSFSFIRGKYNIVELDTSTVIQAPINDNSTPSSLDPRVQDIIRLFSDKQLLINTLQKFDIDTKRMPLGKISKTQISKGIIILNQLAKFLSSGAVDNMKEFGVSDPETYRQKRITELSSEFWTVIPFACGRERPPRIETSEHLGRCQDLIQILSNVGIASKVVSKRSNVDVIYDSMKITLTPVEKQTKDWDLIEQYVKNTQGSTHSYNLELMEAFAIDKLLEGVKNDTYNLFDKIPNHMLLIHGSRMANFMGILTEGFRIPRLTQVVNGSVLGRGIYFADCVTKSFNYCHSCETDKIGLLFLCEVALGNPDIVQTPKLDVLSADHNSRIAYGTTGADLSKCQHTDNGVIVPCGPMKPVSLNGNHTFQYNEYVIYNIHQYRFRYLLKLRQK